MKVTIYDSLAPIGSVNRSCTSTRRLTVDISNQPVPNVGDRIDLGYDPKPEVKTR
jgi:hypothetical protein